MKSKLRLKENPTLEDFHRYIRDLVAERGYKKDSLVSFRHFVEEVGELSRAIRNMDSASTEAHREELKQELADTFIFLLDIANQYNINLEDAFRNKEEENKRRGWGK